MYIFKAAPSPAKLIPTTELSALRLGHPAANAGPPIGPDAKPARMRHICKNMQKAVQNTYTRLLTIIGISGPSLSDGKSVSESRISRIQITYHKFVPVPVVANAAALGAGESQDAPDDTMVHHHGAYRYRKGGQYRGPFLRRVHRALMMLGPWEGRIVAFVLGAIPVLSAVDSIIGTNGTFFDGRLWYRRAPTHVLGHGRVARPRHPRRARARGNHLGVRRGGRPHLFGD